MAKRLDAVHQLFLRRMREGALEKQGGVKLLAGELGRPEKTIRNWRDQELSRQESAKSTEDARAIRDELHALAHFEGMMAGLDTRPPGEGPSGNIEAQIVMLEDQLAVEVDPPARHYLRVKIKELQAHIAAPQKRK